MRIFINKNNKGLTLIEILVSVVVGSIMMIAIYFSFSVLRYPLNFVLKNLFCHPNCSIFLNLLDLYTLKNLNCNKKKFKTFKLEKK